MDTFPAADVVALAAAIRDAFELPPATYEDFAKRHALIDHRAAYIRGALRHLAEGKDIDGWVTASTGSIRDVAEVCPLTYTPRVAGPPPLAADLGEPAGTSEPDHPFVRPGQVSPDCPQPDNCVVCGLPEAAHPKPAQDLAAAESSPDNPYGSQAKHGEFTAPSAAAVAEDVDASHLVPAGHLPQHTGPSRACTICGQPTGNDGLHLPASLPLPGRTA